MEQLWEKRGGKLILKQLTSFHSTGLNKQKQAYSLETTSVIFTSIFAIGSYTETQCEI